MEESTLGALGLLKAMIQQAARDMERDEEVDGFPNGEMAALDFFHSEVFDDLCYGSGIDPDGLLATESAL